MDVAVVCWIIGATFLLYAAYAALRNTPANDEPTPPITYQRLVLVGPRASLNPGSAAELTAALHHLGLPTTLQIQLSDDQISFAVICEDAQTARLLRAIHAALPDCEVSPLPYSPDDRPCITGYLDAAKRSNLTPLKPIQDYKLDPLTFLLEAFQPLWAELGEQADVRFLIRPIDHTHRVYQEWDQFVRSGRYTPQIYKAYAERLQQPLFELLVTVSLFGQDQARLLDRARSVQDVLHGEYNALVPTAINNRAGGLYFTSFGAEPTKAPALASSWEASPSGTVVTSSEVAALFHLPSDQVKVPGVRFLRHSASILPQRLLLATGIALGSCRYRDQQVTINLPFEDLHTTHFAIPAGQTGMGKSTSFTFMASELVRHPGRPSLIVLDPHFSLCEAIASRVIPEERLAHTYLFELGDVEFPIGLSMFRRPPNLSLDAFIQITFQLFRLIFEDHWSSTRMADAIHSLTTTLCTIPGSTLLDAPRLLSDPSFRRRTIARLDDPITLGWWSWYEEQTAGVQRQIASPIVSRLRSLFRARAVRNLICQAGGVDWSQLVDEGAIILVSFAGSEILAEADLLGEMIISKLQLEVMARLTRSQRDYRRAYIMIDESQRYKGDSLRVILSEARKVSAHLLLATQYINQWDEKLASAVLGNVGNKLCFRCGPEDSSALSRSFRPFTADQLENLDQHECVASLTVGGERIPPFAFKTYDYRALNEAYPARTEVLAQIRQQTRARFTRPRAEIERQLGLDLSSVNSGPHGMPYDFDEDEA